MSAGLGSNALSYRFCVEYYRWPNKALDILMLHTIEVLISGGSSISQTGGQPISWPNFPEKYMKMKKSWWRCARPCAPSEVLMVCVIDVLIVFITDVIMLCVTNVLILYVTDDRFQCDETLIGYFPLNALRASQEQRVFSVYPQSLAQEP